MKIEDNKNHISEKRFDSILLKFLIDEPFFATIVRSFSKHRTREIPTAGVMCSEEEINLFWNPDFLSELEVKEVFGLLKHECYHLIFGHITSRKQEPHVLWNIATDLAINSLIPISELPKSGLIPGIRPEIEINKDAKISQERMKKIENLADFIESLPTRKASEWYMHQIKNNKEIAKDFEDLYGTKSVVTLDEHMDSDLSEVDAKITNAKVEKILKDARKIGRQRGFGSLDVGTKTLIDEKLSVRVDWKKALSYFCGTKQRANKSRTFRRINKKYPYIHAGTKKRKTSSLAVYIDESGSVRDDEVVKFFKALEKLSSTHSFTVYPFDSKVSEDKSFVWKKGEKVKLVRHMCGGTSFHAVEKHYRKVSKNYDGYIVMTDGGADKPKTCISKRCWVLLPDTLLAFLPDKRDTIVKMR